MFHSPVLLTECCFNGLLLIWITLLFVYVPTNNVKHCWPTLHYANIALLSYFAFALVRKILLILYCVICSAKPNEHYHVGWVAFICLDVLVLPALFIYCIMAINDDPRYTPQSIVAKNDLDKCFLQKARGEVNYYKMFLIVAGLINGALNVCGSACICCCVVIFAAGMRGMENQR